MVIVAGTQGQFCNQLFRLGHHVANALQLGYEVNCADFEHRHLFPQLMQHQLVSDEPLLSGFQQKLLKVGTRRPFQGTIRRLFEQQGYAVLDRAYEFDQADRHFLEQATQQRVIATHWDFRDYESFNRQYVALKTMFALPEQAQNEASELLTVARQQGDIVVGIHLRRGDYAGWKGGKYYYDDSAYAGIMAHIIDLLPEKKVAFVLCSNEPIKQSSFSNWSTAISNKTFLGDLATLSQCDLLIGPPSTFSGWASFIGQVPHYHMHQSNARPSLQEFVPARG
ncbi:alpha-1,2-fucosyltransferase [Fibrella sp. WM1]|uniref:alpha-1,2-fucosyltransferase n=1 Tax=Fibrella musci TaxID=3242485 RepID=UPI00352302EF